MLFHSQGISRRRQGRPVTTSCVRPGQEALESRLLLSSVNNLHIVASPSVNHSFLNATAAIAFNDIWAVGEFTNPSTGLFQPLAEHFNGTSWSVVSTPALPSGNYGELHGVTAFALNDVWAVGETENTNRGPLIEHFDGAKWSVVSGPSPSAGGILNAVTAISDNDVWAVGSGNLIEHFNGTKWSVVPAPNSSLHTNLYGVSGSSSSDVWAVGSIGRHPGVQVLHWNGHAWSSVSAPSPAFDSSLRSVTTLAPNNVWAAGETNVGPVRTLIEHFDGTRWSVIASPNAGGAAPNANNALTGIAAVSANDIWAVGTFTDPNTGFDSTLTEHFDGTRWCVISSPNATADHNALNGVTALGTGTVVAAGYSIDPNGHANGLILQGGRATIKTAPKLLTATAIAGAVKLTWSAVVGATGYWVHFGTSSYVDSMESSPFLVENATSTTAEGLVPGQKYFFWVQATNSVSTGPNSNELTARPK